MFEKNARKLYEIPGASYVLPAKQVVGPPQWRGCFFSEVASFGIGAAEESNKFNLGSTPWKINMEPQ